MTVHFSKSVRTKTWLRINGFSQIAPRFKAYFSISSQWCWKAKTGWGFSWETPVRQAKKANTALLSLPMCKHTHSDGQANVCSNTTRKVRGSFYGLGSTPLFVLQLTPSLLHVFVSLLYVKVWADEVRVDRDDTTVCFGESLCLVCTVWGLTPSVTLHQFYQCNKQKF